MGKLYLDNIVFSLQKSGGISIVWYELLKRLLASQYQKDICLLEYEGKECNMFRSILRIPAGVRVLSCKPRFLSVARYLNPFVKADGRFLFHSSYYRTCSNSRAVNITTVHDFTYEYYVKGLRKWIHCWQKHRAIRKSDYVICVSENTKRDLLHFLPDVDADKVRVIYNGVSDDYYPLNDVAGLALPYAFQSYALFVGSRASYKNFPLAVEAVSMTDLNLVIVGGALSATEQELLDKYLAGRYYYAGHVSNQQLNRYYNGAFCLIYPSAYEGFGIPVIEAQKAGCPVIAAKVSSIPEVMGDVSFLLPQLSVESVVEHVNQLKDSSFRKSLVEKGWQNMGRFTWDIMYEQVLKLYEQALMA